MTLAAWPTYHSYKNSGEGWIEDVPAHWETRKLKQLFQEKRHRPNLALNCGAISFGEVVEKDDERVPLATKASYQEVLAGEFLVNPLNLNYDLKSLRIGLSDINVVVSAGYIVLQAKDDMDKRYFKYLLHRYDVANMKLLGSGVRQTISFNHIANSILVAPPLPEQRAIAAFLDEKCAKVDEAVRIKEEQITVLRERRQILIQQAVTRGLNPAAPMKDSGIDWIGQIPAHWEVKRLKHLGNAVIGLTYDPKDLCDEDEGTLVLRSSNLKSGKFVYGDGLNAYVRMRIPEKLRIRANDILICSRNGSRDLIGKCALATHDDTGASFGAFTTVFRSEMNRYIFQILNSEIFRMLAGSFLTATINQLTTSNLNSISVPIPPPEERQALTEHLEGLNSEYDRAISFKEDQIAALKEYKTCLINAAVTGKIKVA